MTAKEFADALRQGMKQQAQPPLERAAFADGAAWAFEFLRTRMQPRVPDLDAFAQGARDVRDEARRTP
jgi:hypothetical protein